MKRVFLLIICCIATTGLLAQDSLQARIVLIGDAGQFTHGVHPVVSAVKQHVKFDDITSVVFLGDNLYKTGLPDNSIPTYSVAKAPLDSQINISPNPNTKIYFVPGNHDWANGGSNGYASILRVQNYIDLLGNKNVVMYPRDGCPGPVDIELTDSITLVMLDSQWWLHEYEKPGIESDCECKTEDEVLVQLEDILSKNSSKLVLLAMHHPFKSYGPHGGFFTIKQHIFPLTDLRPNLWIPLPVVGSVYPLTRAVFGTAQDLKHPFYQNMIHGIDNILKEYKNVIHLAGHEHTMQYIVDSTRHYIISGSGSKNNRVSKGRNTKYATSNNGFAVLEITKDMKSYVKFYEVEPDSLREAYSSYMFKVDKLPIETPDTLREVEFAFGDSVVISASDKFKNWSGFKSVLLGDNYQAIWSEPVTFKVLNIRKEKGGLKVKSLGGGKQTKSLKLIDRNGKEWALRTVEKDPSKALPMNLRGTIAENIVSNMISASHPYAPLAVAHLALAAGIIAAPPEYFFVPDDPALGEYRPLFANTVCTLEDRDPTVTDDTDNSKSTGKIINKMLEDNDHHVDQAEVLKARLLDMLIADFDRHADQWKWGTGDTGKGKLYYPIPRDRDQAFFKSDGLLVGYLSRRRMPFLEGFNEDIHSVKRMNSVAKDFDRIFLNHLQEEDWERIIGEFIASVPDSVIDAAVRKMPAPIFAMHGEEAARKLKSRRDQLMKEGMKYYRFLSNIVAVTGSNKDEYFHLAPDTTAGAPDGAIRLEVFRKDEAGNPHSIMYQRAFDPRHTREIRLFALNGDDKIFTSDALRSKIKVRVIGGKGNDTFDLRGNIQKHLYDLRYEKNVMLNTRRTNMETSNSPSVNEYDPTWFEYNSLQYPKITLGYNQEDGLLAGVGFRIITHSFRNKPYATNQRFSTLFAPTDNAYRIRYKGEFNKVISKYDLVVDANLVNPTLNNFFGLGNSTEFDKDLPRRFYRVRYKYLETDVLFRKRLNPIIHISAGPSLYHYWARYEQNKDRILSNLAAIGEDSAGVYGRKSYLGAKARVDINYINNEINPTRGVTWYTIFSALSGISSKADGITSLESHMTIYAAVTSESRVSAVFRLGGGHIFNERFKYFQAMNLGANNFLRGFRKNRFSGRTMAYGGSEVRVRLFDSKSYIFPGKVGVLGFLESGRVWMPNDNSKRWHTSYGGGLFYYPYNLIMVSATMGFSGEEKLFNFTLGTKFNLTF